MNEFSLIHRYFAPLTKGDKGALSLQDDAALITPTPGKQLVITTDAMTENVHFFAGDEPFNLARKLLRVNLSDLAAMGATPLYYLLACVFPRSTPESWIKDFTRGLASDNQEFNIHVLGGDTTSQDGPLTLALTAIGHVEHGKALTRSGAKPGDMLYVSGTIGDAALALLYLEAKKSCPEALLSRYYLPQPRIALGPMLLPFASSAMDISDGLLQDASHIARNSQVELVIHAKNIPLSPAARIMLTDTAALLPTILTGGDDYELLFTAPPAYRQAILALAEETGVAITEIGLVQEGSGVNCLDKEGKEIYVAKGGYQHF